MHLANAVSMNSLQSVPGDLVHALRALAKERAQRRLAGI
jgi:hypothetical protein